MAQSGRAALRPQPPALPPPAGAFRGRGPSGRPPPAAPPQAKAAAEEEDLAHPLAEAETGDGEGEYELIEVEDEEWWDEADDANQAPSERTDPDRLVDGDEEEGWAEAAAEAQPGEESCADPPEAVAHVEGCPMFHIRIRLQFHQL